MVVLGAVPGEDPGNHPHYPGTPSRRTCMFPGELDVEHCNVPYSITGFCKLVVQGNVLKVQCVVYTTTSFYSECVVIVVLSAYLYTLDNQFL